jgi:DNA-binding MarR family transcriptional regulator
MRDKKSFTVMLINRLYRYTQSYIDEALKKYELSSGTYPFLLMLNRNEGISQNQISKVLNVDKAMSARAIKRLIELGYIRRDIDESDSRANKLFLTDRARDVIPKIRVEIDRWIEIITKDSSEEEKNLAVDFLDKALTNAKNYRDGNQ